MSDDSNLIEDSELLAYLEGEELPHVEQALAHSAELRAELETLRRDMGYFQRAFGGIDRPDPQDLVDVVTGQATARQQMRVAAYLRQSKRARAEMAALQQAYAQLTAPPKPPRLRLPSFLAVPLLGGSHRGEVAEAEVA